MMTLFTRVASALAVAGMFAAPAFAAVEKAGTARTVIESEIAEISDTVSAVTQTQRTGKEDGAVELLAWDVWGWLTGGGGGPR